MNGPLTCRRKGPLHGSIEVPGDKSISHRALLFGALSTGETRVRGLLDAEDVHSTRRAVEALGAVVRREGDEIVVVPPAILREPGDVVDCGNSGTSLRLLTGVLVRRARALDPHGRRLAPPPAGPARHRPAATDGRGPLGARRRSAAARGRARPAAPRRAPRARGRERAGEERVPARRPLRGGRDLRARAGALARSHRADARRDGRAGAGGRARGGHRAGAAARRSRRRPRRHLLGGVLPLRRRRAPRVRGDGAEPRREPDAHGAARRARGDGGGRRPPRRARGRGRAAGRRDGAGARPSRAPRSAGRSSRGSSTSSRS